MTGTPVGRLRGRHEKIGVSAAPDGVLAGWPVRGGDPDDAGNLPARPHPEVS